MPIWMFRRGQRGHHAGPEPHAEHRRADQQHQRRHLDFHDGDVDEGLHDRRQRVPDVQRPGQEFVPDGAVD